MAKTSFVTMEETLAAIEDYKREIMQPLTAPEGLSGDQILKMYRRMALIREFDTSVKGLWKQNYIYGLAHSYVCAEAIGVGACAALRDSDFITSTHRGHGHTIAKGGDVKKMMAELMGKYDGYCLGKGGSMHIAAVDEGMLGATGIVGSGMPIAVGAALSSKVLGKDNVVVCFHGDGGTNQGVWHESINLAATWDLPVIFLCENNQWAISLPYKKASKNPRVSDRAIGYGIPGVTVDGFNVFAVYNAVAKAVERARSGNGPTLIEAKYYRYIGHFVADDERYRDMATNAPWTAFDPVERMCRFLVENGGFSEEQVQAVYESAKQEVLDAIEYAKTAPEPPLSSLYDGIYSPEFMEILKSRGEYVL
ncbi:MAG: thiamine pyrophosphate-dependent dehydrogenase E1 component subunit alpha [Anaerolineaceae bacterium]|nr:thiamine pyrophosphate-dependent dehydrogenase E1 component subunit alpha [Anaerolineaceae bacterium]